MCSQGFQIWLYLFIRFKWLESFVNFVKEIWRSTWLHNCYAIWTHLVVVVIKPLYGAENQHILVPLMQITEFGYKNLSGSYQSPIHVSVSFHTLYYLLFMFYVDYFEFSFDCIVLRPISTFN